MMPIFFKYLEFFPFVSIMFSIFFGTFFTVFKRSSIFMFLNTLLSILFNIFYFYFFNNKLCNINNFFFHFDKLSIFFSLLILFSGLVIVLFSYFCLCEKNIYISEYYLLLLLLMLGSLSLNFAKHIFIFFISVEIITLSTVGLIYFFNKSKTAIEASLKYMIFSSFVSLFILFGIGLIYFINGNLEYIHLFSNLQKYDFYEKISIFLGITMLLMGIFFKISLFPFHFIFPDVYQVSDPIYLMCFSIINKISFLSFLTYFFLCSSILQIKFFYILIYIMSVLSIFFGNFLAIFQKNLKRLLGYLSISQSGYSIIVILSLLNKFTYFLENIFLYFINYVICNICFFGSMAIIKRCNFYIKKNNIFSNIYNSYFLLSLSMFIVLFSLSGVPPTIGFINKLYIFSYSICNHFWIMSLVILISNILGMYIYFKILISICNDNKINNNLCKYDFYYIKDILGIIIFVMSICLIFFNFSFFYNFFFKILFSGFSLK